MTSLDRTIQEKREVVLAILMIITAFVSIIPQFITSSTIGTIVLVLYITVVVILTIALTALMCLNASMMPDINKIKTAVLGHCVNKHRIGLINVSYIIEYIIRYRFQHHELYFYLKWILISILAGSLLYQQVIPFLVIMVVAIIIHETTKYVLYKEFLRLYTKISPTGYSKQIHTGTLLDHHIHGERLSIYELFKGSNMWEGYILL